MSKKQRVAKLSIISNSALIAMKLAVGLMTGAVSIISEAVHSFMDLIAAAVAYFSVKFAERPPDESHPYGHEKIENISGVIETLLIFAASFFIIKEAVHKLTHHTEVEFAGLGFAVMAVSAIVNYFISRKLYAVSKAEESVAIEADALHLKTDVYTSAGVALGLLVLWITDLHVLDPLIAILIALFILVEAARMLAKAIGPLLDAKLSDDEIKHIHALIGGYRDVFLDFHELRTRRSGNIKHMDLHMTFPSRMTVQEFHDICDNIERDIESAIRRTKVLIHGEPCSNRCDTCKFMRRSKYCLTVK